MERDRDRRGNSGGHREIDLAEGRTLSSADVSAIVTQLQERMTENFFKEIGKAAFGVVWRTSLVGLGIMAIIGQLKQWGLVK